ncbi:MAG: hypothetical protein KJ950_14370 [Proteobacteria bacterium]|nr:hypothetical protein [Pseudomonadota bacterium]MBU1687892.1 hypothetical protein [Pseudomonadota bacterium]
MAVFKKCECGAQTVQFHLRDNLLQQDVISRLYCPSCPGGESFNQAAMINDNGWIIEYDMILAVDAISRNKLVSPEMVTPEYIFDLGYCTWLETYPGEKTDIHDEREAILKLRETNQQMYLKEIMAWNIKRLEELKTKGWRKAVFA